MVINTNTQAQATAHNLLATQAQLSKSLARLSSGSKLVDPGDDAAGMARSARIDAQLKRTSAAQDTLSNAVSFTQTQDGYLGRIGKALDRMSELALQAQDVTKSPGDLELYGKEFKELASYIQEAAGKDFNGVSLFSSADTSVTPDQPLNITVDSEGSFFAMGRINLHDLAAFCKGVTGDPSTSTSPTITIDNAANAASALTDIKANIDDISGDRAQVGAYQARLNYTFDQLIVSKENLTAANSRIKDVDIAEESTEFARQNILNQSGTAMLAQANQLPQSVLRLLQ